MEEPERPIPIALRCRGIRADRARLRRLMRHCLETEGVAADAGCGLVLAGDRLLRALNRQWRGLDRPTDVLSFPMEKGPPLPPEAREKDARLRGEIVISVPRCREQARDAGCEPGVELVRLVIHGLLHILGHDHERAGDRARMVARERRHRAWAARAGIGRGLLQVRP
jgi:probable rRNA maturation factor